MTSTIKVPISKETRVVWIWKMSLSIFSWLERKQLRPACCGSFSCWHLIRTSKKRFIKKSMLMFLPTKHLRWNTDPSGWLHPILRHEFVFVCSRADWITPKLPLEKACDIPLWFLWVYFMLHYKTPVSSCFDSIIAITRFSRICKFNFFLFLFRIERLRHSQRNDHFFKCTQSSPPSGTLEAARWI